MTPNVVNFNSPCSSLDGSRALEWIVGRKWKLKFIAANNWGRWHADFNQELYLPKSKRSIRSSRYAKIQQSRDNTYMILEKYGYLKSLKIFGIYLVSLIRLISLWYIVVLGQKTRSYDCGIISFFMKEPYENILSQSPWKASSHSQYTILILKVYDSQYKEQTRKNANVLKGFF